MRDFLRLWLLVESNAFDVLNICSYVDLSVTTIYKLSKLNAS